MKLYYSLIIILPLLACTKTNKENKQEKKPAPNEQLQDQSNLNPTQKEIMIFKDWGSLTINEDSLNVYSNLDIISSGNDSTYATINPKKGFCINHINSLDGKDFLQFILFLQPSEEDITELYQFDMQNMSKQELSSTKAKFKNLFKSSVFSFKQYKKLNSIDFINMGGVNCVKYSFDRNPHEYSPDPTPIQSTMITFSKGNYIGSILIERHINDIEVHQQLINEVIASIQLN